MISHRLNFGTVHWVHQTMGNKIVRSLCQGRQTDIRTFARIIAPASQGASGVAFPPLPANFDELLLDAALEALLDECFAEPLFDGKDPRDDNGDDEHDFFADDLPLHCLALR